MNRETIFVKFSLAYIPKEKEKKLTLQPCRQPGFVFPNICNLGKCQPHAYIYKKEETVQLPCK